MLTLEERPRYRPDFGVAWLRLPVLIVLGLVAAAGLAWGLKVAYVNGWYLVVVWPVFGRVHPWGRALRSCRLESLPKPLAGGRPGNAGRTGRLPGLL